MDILFCGLGSIGQRHIRNLAEVLKQHDLEYRIDAVRSSDRELPEDIEKLLDTRFTDIAEIKDSYDIVFITNPTSLHYDTLKIVAAKAGAVFIEKPVFGDADVDIEALGLRDDAVYYVACPLRHHPVVKKIKEYVSEKRVSAVRAICSSYLPEWRKDTDYRKNYSASREQGGGVVLDLIHEWDYLTWLFGMPLGSEMYAAHVSELEIDSDDVALYIAKYKNMLLSLHLDYIGRVPMRSITLYCSDEIIVGDILANTVLQVQANKIETCAAVDVHLAEMQYFISCVLTRDTRNMNTIPNALRVLKLAQGKRKKTKKRDEKPGG